MSACFICGSPHNTFLFGCGECKKLSVLEDISSSARSMEKTGRNAQQFAKQSLASQSRMEELQLQYLPHLAELPIIASTLEWGFTELIWQTQQQSEVLRSIDQKLDMPIQIEAKELRRIGEELRSRGDTKKAVKFLSESLEKSPLDFRTYVGLALAYLELNDPRSAQQVLEESLSHAPDAASKAYAYRLLGRIAACTDDYRRAAGMLHKAIEVSPSYVEAHYDYAQYTARLEARDACFLSLRHAVTAVPIYWHMAEKERNFDPIREDVRKLLVQLLKKAIQMAQVTIGHAEKRLMRVKGIVEQALDSMTEGIEGEKVSTREDFEQCPKCKARVPIRETILIGPKIECPSCKLRFLLQHPRTVRRLGFCKKYDEMSGQLGSAKELLGSRRYVDVLEADEMAKVCGSLADTVEAMVPGELALFRAARREKQEETLKAILGTILGWAVILGIGGSIVGFAIGSHRNHEIAGVLLGALLGSVLGLALWRITRAL